MALQVIGIVIALAFLVIAVYFGLSMPVAAIVSSFIIIVTNGLSVTESFTTGFGMFGTILGTLAPLYLFGGIMGLFYLESGGADSIAEACMSIFKNVKNEAVGIMGSFFMLLVIRIIFGLAGLDAAAILIVFIGLSNSICRRYNLGLKYVVLMNSIAVTVGNIIPATPNTVNIMAEMYIEGFDNYANIAIRLAFLIVFMIGAILLTYLFIIRDRKKGMVYVAPHGTLAIPDQGADVSRPNWIISIIPIAVTFIIYVACRWDAWLCLLVGVIACVICFGKYLPREDKNVTKVVLKLIDRGSFVIPMMIVMVVVPTTIMATSPGFSSIVGGLSTSGLHPAVVLLIIALIVLGFSGMGGFPVIADDLKEMQEC